MTPLRKASLQSMAGGAVDLQLERGWRARVSMVDGHTGRFTLLPPEGFREPRTWALDPDGAFPLEGRRRDALFVPDATATARRDGDAVLLVLRLGRLRSLGLLVVGVLGRVLGEGHACDRHDQRGQERTRETAALQPHVVY